MIVGFETEIAPMQARSETPDAPTETPHGLIWEQLRNLPKDGGVTADNFGGAMDGLVNQGSITSEDVAHFVELNQLPEDFNR